MHALEDARQHVAQSLGVNATTQRRYAACSQSLAFLVATALLLLPIAPTSAVEAGAVVINPGDNIQAAVDNKPEGTAFFLKAGVHRLQSITPKNGNVFAGEPGTVLNGAKLLTAFVREGNYWVGLGRTQQPGARVGTCMPNYERCNYPQDLFFDDAPLRHVGSLAAVVPGSWYFDYPAGKIYLANPPAAHKVEMSVTTHAFYGSASNVTIKGLVIEKYANPAQTGAVHAMTDPGPLSDSWTVQNCEIRYNHGGGIRTGSRLKVVGNYIHHNGEIGIVGSGASILVDRNEIAYNNYAGYDYNWEAGGTKFVATLDLTVRRNFVHHNEGPGLWTDSDNAGTIYESNRTSNNRVAGIFHEISYDATIKNNTVEGDGYNPLGSGLWNGAGILVAASSGVQIYGNTVIDCMNGIGVNQPDRGRSSRTGRPYLVQNLYVHDNIVMQNSGIAAGLVKVDAVFDDSVYTSWNNRFAHNTYRLGGVNTGAFVWIGGRLTKDGWRAYGNDAGGTFK